MTTLAALEHQWAESSRQLTEAHELVRRLTAERDKLAMRMVRAKEAQRRRNERCPTTGPTSPGGQTARSAAAKPPT